MPTEGTQYPFDKETTQQGQVAAGSDLFGGDDNLKLSSKSKVVAGNTHKRWHRWAAAAAAVSVLAGAVTGTTLALTRGKSKASATRSPSRAKSTASTGYASFQALYGKLAPSIAQVNTTGCDGTAGSGSGFAVDAHHIVTAGHVVEGSQQMTVIVGGSPVPAQVVGLDQSGDVALLHSDQALPGPYVPLATSQPSVGERVAALGFPLGGGLSMTQGSVSAINQNETVDDVGQIVGMVQTDTAINPGNSGGPLVALDGTAAGIVDASNTQANGVGYAISAPYASSEVANWIASPQSHPMPLCSTPTPQNSNPAPANSSAAAPAPSVSQSDPWAIVSEYYGDITSKDYSDAWALWSPNMQAAQGGYSAWVAGYARTGAQSVTEVSESGSQVSYYLESVNPDGTIQWYQDSVTVSNGQIQSADVIQLSGDPNA